jgi:hypothetical protein
MFQELDFDYEKLQGQSVKGIFGQGILVFDDSSIAFDKVEIQLENCKLSFFADIDTDEVICRLFNEDVEREDMRDIDSMSGYLGSELGWIWVARNWLGYRDMIVLSFEGIDPTIAMIGMASKLKLCRFESLKL